MIWESEVHAYSEDTKKKQIFNTRENTWQELPHQFEQYQITHRYLESLKL